MKSRSRCYYFLLGAALCDLSCSAAGRQGLQVHLFKRPTTSIAQTESSGRVVLTSSEEDAEPSVKTALAESFDSQPRTDDEQDVTRDISPPTSLPQTEAPLANEAVTDALATGNNFDPVVLPAPLVTSTKSDEVILEPAGVTESDNGFPINLATALRLSNARPLTIAAAQASAWVAEAQLQRAQVLWVPQFNVGAVYYRHDGFGPDFNRGVNNPAYGGPTPGGPLNQNLNYFYGYGSFFQTLNLTDAIFQPLAARQVLDAERQEIQAAKNDALLATANAYFDVHQHRGQYTATLDVIQRSQKLVARIEQLSEDLVPTIEVDRSRRLLAAMMQRAALSRERWRIASANLTQILRLDPTAVIVPTEPDHLQITLIDPSRTLDELVEIGVKHRPEISSNISRIKAAEVRVRQEKYRPFLPLVLLTGFQTPGGMMSQFGIFGEGSGSALNHWSMREDVSLQLIWQLEGFGFGNLARIKEQRGIQSDATVQLFTNQDKVAGEVTSAQARIQSTSVRALQAERELREAIISYDGNYDGLAQTTRFENVLHQVFRPQEAVKALEKLMDAYDLYFATVAEYNRAQFELFHALGYPAREVIEMNSPGEIMSVNTERPFGLPSVSEGPPPAER